MSHSSPLSPSLSKKNPLQFSFPPPPPNIDLQNLFVSYQIPSSLLQSSVMPTIPPNVQNILRSFLDIVVSIYIHFVTPKSLFLLIGYLRPFLNYLHNLVHKLTYQCLYPKSLHWGTCSSNSFAESSYGQIYVRWRSLNRKRKIFKYFFLEWRDCGLRFNCIKWWVPSRNWYSHSSQVRKHSWIPYMKMTKWSFWGC